MEVSETAERHMRIKEYVNWNGFVDDMRAAV